MFAEHGTATAALFLELELVERGATSVDLFQVMFPGCEIADSLKVAHRRYMLRVGYKQPGYDGLSVEGNMMGYIERVSNRVQNKAADIRGFRARVYR